MVSFCTKHKTLQPNNFKAFVFLYVPQIYSNIIIQYSNEMISCTYIHVVTCEHISSLRFDSLPYIHLN